MNIALLLSRLTEHGYNRHKLAELLDISYWSVCQKLSNKYEFTQTEIHKIVNALNLSESEIKNIFFSNEN